MSIAGRLLARGGRDRPARVARIAPFLGVLGACTGCGASSEPVTRQGREFHGLFGLFLALGVVVVALIWSLTVWSVIRYRRGRRASPSDRQYHLPLEILYTALPVVIVSVLFALSVRGENRVNELSDHPQVVIDVVGFQWQWQFRYPEEDLVVAGTPRRPPTMVVPVGATVRLRLHADDVVHSFWVPEFLGKRDLVPGRRNEIDVTVTRPGRWQGRCAEFCGFDHWDMRLYVEAVSPGRYEAWIRAAKAANDPTRVPTPEELP